MNLTKIFYGCAVAVFALLVTTSSAQAGIVFLTPSTDITTYGFGVVNPILTMQNDPKESVCVIPGPSLSCTDASLGGAWTSFDPIVGDVNPVSAPKYTTPTLADLNIMGYTDIGILFNVNEPNNVEEITLQMLSLGFFDSNGILVHAFYLENPYQDFTDIEQGQGKAGFVGTITQAQADAAFAAYGFDSSWTIGMAAQAGCFEADEANCNVTGKYSSGDGPESFTVVSLGNPPVDLPGVPEPSTYLMFGAGLMAMGYLRRRRPGNS